MLSLFRTQPLLDNDSADWIFASFSWALSHFDAEEFFQRTPLVQPSNEFFPGDVSSVEEKAANIFAHSLRHAGLSHWPFQLLSQQQLQQNPDCQLPPAPQPQLAQIERHSHELVKSESQAQSGTSQLPAVIESEQPLQVFFNPQQTLKPQDMAASYAQVIAQHLMLQARQLPPGGQPLFAQASELLAGFLGFGVLITNSTYTIRGGCGSCYNPQANRQSALTELDNVFILALFCRLKGINKKQALANVKKHLHSSYKQALKQIEQHPQLPQLLALKPA